VFPPDESATVSGEVVDNSADAGDVQAKRKYLEVVVAEGVADMLEFIPELKDKVEELK